MGTFANRDGRVLEYFKLLFNQKQFTPKLIIGSRFISRIIVKDYNVKDNLPIQVPSYFEVLLLFHCCSVYTANKAKITALDWTTSTRMGYVIQRLVSAWQRFVSLSTDNSLATLTELFTPYINFNHNALRFDVLNSKSQGYSSSDMERTLVNAKATLERAKVNVTAFNRTTVLDESIRLIVSLFFRNLDHLIQMPFLHEGKEQAIRNWKELYKFRVPSNVDKLPSVFSDLPDSAFEAFGIEKQCESPGSDEDGVFRLDLTKEDGNNANKRKHAEIDGDVQIKEEDTKTEPVLIEAPENIAYRPSKNREMAENTRKQYDITNFLMFDKFKLLESNLQDFPDLAPLDAIELEGNVDLVLTDIPYNIRRSAEKVNSDYDKFSQKDMKDLCNLCKYVMKPGTHGLIFCSYQQFEMLRTELNTIKIPFDDLETDDSGNTSGLHNLFIVDPTPIVAIKRDDIAMNPVRGGGTHSNLTEICLHFWKRGGESHDSRRNVNFGCVPSFGSKYPGWCNVINEVPQPTGGEVRWMYPEDHNADDGSRLSKRRRTERRRVRPEQKSVEILKYLISKYSKPGDTVMDPCAGTASTMHACMLLDKHRKFVGCEPDSDAILAVEDHLIATFAGQLLNKDSDIDSTEVRFRNAAKTVKNYHAQQVVNENYNAWRLPDGLVGIQTFPEHVVEYLCQVSEDFSLISRRDTPLTSWPDKWVQRLNAVNVPALRAYECMNWNIRIKKSTIKHPHSGLGVFAKKGFKTGDIIGYYYGTLVYGDLDKAHRVRKRYGEGLMSVSSDEYRKWALQLKYPFTDARNKKHTGYICPGPFNAMRYTNSFEYIEGDPEKEAYDKKTLLNPRCANCQYKLINTQRTFLYEKYTACPIQATRDILPGEELLLDYGDSYTYPHTKGDHDGTKEVDDTTKDATEVKDTKEVKLIVKSTAAGAATEPPVAKTLFDL